MPAAFTWPSASAHLVPVVVAPGELCASYQLPPGHHIARSTMIGTPLVERMVVETPVLASLASS